MINYHDIEYHSLLENIRDYGNIKHNRTGIDTLSIFATNMSFDMSDGFPLITTKKVHWKSIIHELIWFLRGDTNIKYLKDNGVSIWDEWADEEGNVGPLYGSQWRRWEGKRGEVDQIYKAIHDIIVNPNSRRILVSAWNTTYLPHEGLAPRDNPQYGKMALAPCHAFFQFYVNENTLNMQMYQRSVDAFLGLPFNIASYAALLHLIAKITNKEPGTLFWVGGDTHIYVNHIEQVDLQLSRDSYQAPTLEINLPKVSHWSEIFNQLKFEHFNLMDYKSHPAIKAPIAI
jgi:thymidylate synthase